MHNTADDEAIERRSSAEFMEEVFAMYVDTGVKPKELTGKERRDYEKWLKKEQSTGS